MRIGSRQVSCLIADAYQCQLEMEYYNCKLAVVRLRYSQRASDAITDGCLSDTHLDSKDWDLIFTCTCFRFTRTTSPKDLTAPPT